MLAMAQKSLNEYPEYLTTREAAEVLRVHLNTIKNWLYSGELPGIKSGRKWLIRRDDLEKRLQGEK